MTSTTTSFLLKLVTGLMVLALVTGQDRPYPPSNRYLKRPQQDLQPVEPPQASPKFSFPDESEPQETAPEAPVKVDQPAKVIIKLASAVPPIPTNKDSSNNENKNGCNCEKLDACPIELMDFSFSVSCPYGTVRCCRPVEPIVEPTTPAPEVTPVPVAPVVKRPGTKKPAMCKCKSRKECDLFFRVEESEQIDRKDECPAGSVRCCETGNMGNPKESMLNNNNQQKETHQILGNSGFRPIQLPYLKMPNTERISDTNPEPPAQELQQAEKQQVQTSPVNQSTPVETQPAAPVHQMSQRPIQPPQQPVQQTPTAPQLQAPRPLAGQQPLNQQTKPFAVPMRPAVTNQQQPLNVPVNFNSAPIHHQGMGVPIQQQQQQQQQQQFVPMQPQQPVRAQPIHTGLPPFRQPVQPLPQQVPQQPTAMQQQPQATKVEQQALPAGFRPPFGLVPPSPNAPQFPSAPHQQQQPPRAPVNQNFFQQLPPAPPAQVPQAPPKQPASSGGFFSSLMNMFS